MKHKAITKDITTGATNDIRNYESTHATNKYVTHDVINDGTTDLAHDTHTHIWLSSFYPTISAISV